MEAEGIMQQCSTERTRLETSRGRGEFGLAMGIKQSHWPLWPLFHTAADPDDKRIALIPLVLGVAACFREIPEKNPFTSMRKYMRGI